MSNKTRNVIVVVLVALILLVVCGFFFLLNKEKNAVIPDYASGNIDVNAIKEDNSKKEKNTSPRGSGSVNLSFSNIVSVTKSNSSAKLYFKNPGTSTKNVSLYLIIRQGEKEIILGHSDLVPPGYAIYNMKLDNIKDVPEGGYNGILKTVFYDESSNAKEMVDSEIEVKIEVSK